MNLQIAQGITDTSWRKHGGEHDVLFMVRDDNYLFPECHRDSIMQIQYLKRV